MTPIPENLSSEDAAVGLISSLLQNPMELGREERERERERADIYITFPQPMLCAGVTTYAALRRSQARSGQWVVISGAGGGLGMFFVTLFDTHTTSPPPPKSPCAHYPLLPQLTQSSFTCRKKATLPYRSVLSSTFRISNPPPRDQRA